MSKAAIGARLQASIDSVPQSGIGGGFYGSQRITWSPGARLDYERLAGDIWLSSTVAIALGWIQENLAEPPLVVHRRVPGSTEPETIRDHELLDLLSAPTGPKGYDWATLLAGTALSLCLDGNSYWEYGRGPTGQVTEIWWRPHFEFRPVWPTDGSEYISGYARSLDGRLSLVSKNNAGHFRRGIDPRNTRYGLSPTKAQMREILGDQKASNWIAALLRNHAVPSLMITPKTTDVELDRNAREALKREWQVEYGDEQVATVSVASMPIEATRMGWSPKDMDLGTLAHTLESKIVASMGLNTLVLNLPAASTQNKFSNLQEANKHAYQNCLLPLGARICRGIEQSPLGREQLKPGESLAFDWSQVAAMREDRGLLIDQTAKSFGAASAPGWITRDEARCRVGLPPLPGGVGEVLADGKPLVEPSVPDLTTPPPPDPAPAAKRLARAIKADAPITPPRPDLKLASQFESKLGVAISQAEARALAGGEVAPPAAINALADSIQPTIAAQWDASGSAMTADLNRVQAKYDLSQHDWQVNDPNVAAKIRGASVAFSQSTLATMAAKVANAQQVFRAELEAGALSGDPNTVLQQRLRDVFGLSRNKARQVALTEMSRATHAAADQTARDSGVVEGWDWLLSSDACPLCQAIAAESERQNRKLGEPFATIGTHPEYSQIYFSPAHPECNCTVVARLKSEFTGDQATTTSTTANTEEDEDSGLDLAKPKTQFEKLRDEITAAETAQVTANQAAKIDPSQQGFYKIASAANPLNIPPGKIEDRLKQYVVGDAKVKALASLKQVTQDRIALLEVERDALVGQIDDYWQEISDAGRSANLTDIAKLEDLDARRRLVKDRIHTLETEGHADMTSEILAVPADRAQLFGAPDLVKGHAYSGEALTELSANPDLAKRVDESVSWLGKITREGTRPGGSVIDPIERKIGFRKGQRAYCGSDHIALRDDQDHNIIVHEFGHTIDSDVFNNGDPQYVRSKEFLDYRCGAEKQRKLADQFPGRGFRDDEFGRKDKFDSVFDEMQAYYVGKIYSSNTECISMGVQKLWEDPAGFAVKDPEFCKFILGILDGSLR